MQRKGEGKGGKEKGRGRGKRRKRRFQLSSYRTGNFRQEKLQKRLIKVALQLRIYSTLWIGSKLRFLLSLSDVLSLIT